ncbi:MAG TPA: response regulator [Ktedonobacterales bacterium]|nr:response regulator [Ktedonobacterales bacterium]
MPTVLLVEDDPATAEMLTWALERQGYQVLEASDGWQALEHLGRSTTALVVLLDYGLPGLDGLSLLKQISADPRLATRHAYVLMSALHLGRSAIRQQVPFPTPVDFLPKPFELRQLWKVLATATRRIEVVSPSPV